MAPPIDKAKTLESATRAFAKGQWAKALEEYHKLAHADPHDAKMRIRSGDVYLKMGDKPKAIEEYKQAAGIFSGDGYLVQAIAVNKIILDLDPSQGGVQQELARLYAKKGGGEDLVSIPGGGGGSASPAAPAAAPALARPQTPILSELTEEEFLRVVDKLRPVRLAADQVVCLEGDPGDSIYILTSGMLSVTKTGGGGETVWLADLKEGDFFGEFGFVSDSQRHATVTAKGEAEVLEITKADFLEIVRDHPRVKEVLGEFYKNRLLDTFLALSPLFRGLKPEERKEVAPRFHPQVVKEGAVLIREGEEGDSLFLIYLGEVEVSMKSPVGMPTPLARLKEGDFFGEVSLLTGRPRTATVTASKETRLLKLSRDDFNWIITQFPHVLEVAQSYLEKRVEETISTLLVRQGKGSGTGAV